MAIEQVVCPECGGRGGYTRGPYPATRCNYCVGKGWVVVETKPKPSTKKSKEPTNV